MEKTAGAVFSTVLTGRGNFGGGISPRNDRGETSGLARQEKTVPGPYKTPHESLICLTLDLLQ
jgi:hypothetical protein